MIISSRVKLATCYLKSVTVRKLNQQHLHEKSPGCFWQGCGGGGSWMVWDKTCFEWWWGKGIEEDSPNRSNEPTFCFPRNLKKSTWTGVELLIVSRSSWPP